MLKKLLSRIKSALSPATHHDAFLDGIATRYSNEPSSEEPILFTEEELRQLVDLAVAEKLILTTEDGANIPLLTILIGMGTWQGPVDPWNHANPSNADSYLGQKDPRIEDYIATLAKNEASRRKGCVFEHTKRTAVFGSSMNPPSEHHLNFIKHLISSGYFVEIVPNAASPLKSAADYAPQGDRYAMIQLALLDKGEEISPFQYDVSTLELHRPAPSRMFMTLCALILLSEPNETFTLILTLDDNFERFHHWYKWNELGALCSIKFYFRPGISSLIPRQVLADQFNQLVDAGINMIVACRCVTEIESLKEQLGERISHHIEWQEEVLRTTTGSSSAIRAGLKQKPDECPEGLPEVVYQYILEHGLYELRPPAPVLKGR